MTASAAEAIKWFVKAGESGDQQSQFMVPKPMTSNAGAEGRFSKADFIYIAKDDEYQCPAGERAIRRFTTVEHGMSVVLPAEDVGCKFNLS